MTSNLVLPRGVREAPGAGAPPADPASHAVVINETEFSDDMVGDAAMTYFAENASVAGVGRAPSTFGVYSANQGSLLARTEYQTPTNIIEEIKLARELAERDDDVASVIGSMLALAFGEGMENFHEDATTVAIYNSIAGETNLDMVLRDLYREYLIAYQVNTVNLFTRTAVEYAIPGAERLQSDLISWPRIGVIPAETIRVLDNDMFGTGTLAYVPPDERQRLWLDERFNPRTTPARLAEMRRQDPVSFSMFIAAVDLDPHDPHLDPDIVLTNGRVYVLNPRIVQRHTGPKGSWKYPRPLLTRNFALLEAKRLLNLMDFALLQGGANFIIVAKKGTDDHPVRDPKELHALRDIVRRASRTGVVIGDHRLTFDIITPDLQELLNPDKRKLIGRKLARALLRVPELDDESSGAEGTRLDAEFIQRIVASDRHELKRHVERTSYKQIASRNPRLLNRGAPKLWFPRIILQGSQYFNDLVLKLRDRGDIPRGWAVEAGGFDWDAAVQARRREIEAGIDDIMLPADVPFDSPNRGPQDNNPGRPAGGEDDRPRRVVRRTAGETITARFSEELGRTYRIGDTTYAILEDHEDYEVGRVSGIDREMLDGAEVAQRGTSLYVPVNPGHECRSYQAVNLRDGLRMVIGERADGARVAKMFVFREPEFDEQAAEDVVVRWGFPVRMPEPDQQLNTNGLDPEEFARMVAEQAARNGDGERIIEAVREVAREMAQAVREQQPPVVHVHQGEPPNDPQNGG